MHQSHAKTSQDKTGSSLCGKKYGFRVPDHLDKISGRFPGDISCQAPVLLQNNLYHFSEGEDFIFCMIFRCWIMFQNNP
jgi:hypothetical protein